MLNHISPHNEAASGDSGAGNGIDLADDSSRAVDQTHGRRRAAPLKRDHFYDSSLFLLAKQLFAPFARHCFPSSAPTAPMQGLVQASTV